MKKTKVPITWKSGEANQPERPPRVVTEFGARGPYARVYRIVEEWDPEDGSLLSTLECSRPDSMGADSWRTVRGKSRRWDPLVQALKALAMATDETIDGFPFDDLVAHTLRERGKLAPITPAQVERFEAKLEADDDLEKSGAEFWAERWGEKRETP